MKVSAGVVPVDAVQPLLSLRKSAHMREFAQVSLRSSKLHGLFPFEVHEASERGARGRRRALRVPDRAGARRDRGREHHPARAGRGPLFTSRASTRPAFMLFLAI